MSRYWVRSARLFLELLDYQNPVLTQLFILVLPTCTLKYVRVNIHGYIEINDTAIHLYGIESHADAWEYQSIAIIFPEYLKINNQ